MKVKSVSALDLCVLQCPRAGFLGWSAGLLVSDHSLVRGFGLKREFAFGLAHQQVG
jgi:hypothetical protein